jgi:chromosome partitioning protein
VNGRLVLIGYLVSMFNKTLSVHVTYEGFLRELHGPDVFSTMIPHAKDYKEAVTYRKPIVEYKPKSVAGKATAALAEEFLTRLGTRIPSGSDDARRVA